MNKPHAFAKPHKARLPGLSAPVATSPDTLLKQGIALQAKGRWLEAEARYRKVMASEPDNPQAHNLMGLLALNVMDAMEERGSNSSPVASEHFKKAVELEPRNSDYRANLGHALIELKDLDNARKHLRTALDLNPKQPVALYNMGRLFRAEEKYPQAEKYLRRALSADPKSVQALSEIGHLMINIGSLEEARRFFAQALTLDGGDVRSLAGLAETRKVKPGDPVRKMIEARLTAPGLSVKERPDLHHAAGKVMNDLGEYEQAIEHFITAKKLLNRSFDMESHAAIYDAFIEHFDRDFFEQRKDFGDPSDRLVFIVGMPRSGTTLTEQICASHRRVHGVGETSHVRDVAREIGLDSTDLAPFFDSMKNMTREQSRMLGKRLLETYQKENRKALRIVDKMPHNFEMLPLIALLFPNAHIVHCRRNAMDNCVSIYSLNFTEFHSYSTDLTTLGRYYGQYDRLMRHWAQVVPLPMMEMKYEETVADLETRARALIDFIGVDWDDNCLRFHETERSVNTASRWQVRQPIYSSSVKRWKRYGAALDPLKEALGPLAEDD